jgi:hypothetical protein
MRGGKRPRSGRPKGSPNKATAQLQAVIAASGRTPLEIMLESARWAYAQATQLSERLVEAEATLDTAELFSQMLRLRQSAVEWAHFAAPYVHPRLAAVAHRHAHEDGSPVKPIVNVYIDGVPQGDHRGSLSEPDDDIPDRRH